MKNSNQPCLCVALSQQSPLHLFEECRTQWVTALCSLKWWAGTPWSPPLWSTAHMAMSPSWREGWDGLSTHVHIDTHTHVQVCVHCMRTHVSVCPHMKALYAHTCTAMVTACHACLVTRYHPPPAVAPQQTRHRCSVRGRLLAVAPRVVVVQGNLPTPPPGRQHAQGGVPGQTLHCNRPLQHCIAYQAPLQSAHAVHQPRAAVRGYRRAEDYLIAIESDSAVGILLLVLGRNCKNRVLRVPLQVSVAHISDRKARSVLHLSVKVERHLFGYLGKCTATINITCTVWRAVYM